MAALVARNPPRFAAREAVVPPIRAAIAHVARNHPIGRDSAVSSSSSGRRSAGEPHLARAEMQIQETPPDETDIDAPTPENMSSKAGISFPDLAWSAGLPTGQQVCGSNDDDYLRLCCTGSHEWYKSSAMCLTDEGDAAAQALYDCIAAKTSILSPFGIGVACEYYAANGTERLYLNRDGMRRSGAKNATGNAYSEKSKNSATAPVPRGVAGVLGAVVAIAVMGLALV
jgi:hypothetical protein